MGGWEWAHAAIGGAASAIFLFQTLGSADGDAEGRADAGDGFSADEAGGLSDYLSVRNFVAFFMGYGWVALAASLSGMSRVTALFLGAAAGVAFVYVSLLLIRTFLKFQEDGSVKLEELVGKNASVYIAIGAAGAAAGKVLVDTRAGRMELTARTEDARALAVGRVVRVERVDGGVLWVTGE